jgi:chemotaxis protein MotA
MEIAHHMSVALVGTFLGILIAYGVVGPMSSDLAHRAEQESAFYQVIKTCLMSNLNGYAPPVAVEFGRKVVPHQERPSFSELDEYLSTLK